MNERIIVEPYQTTDDTGKPIPPKFTLITPIRVPLSVHLQRVLTDIAWAALIILLWRIPFPAEWKPFAWGYLLAWRLVHPPAARWGLIFLLFGAAIVSFPDFGDLPGRFGPILLSLIMMNLPFKSKALSLLAAGGAAALSAAGLGVLFHLDTLGLVLTAAEPLAGAAIAWVLLPGLLALRSVGQSEKPFEMEQRLSVLTLLVMAFLGLHGLKWEYVTAQGVAATWALLLIADYFGLAYASVVGMGFSLSQMAVANVWLSPIFYGGFGLLAGIGRVFGRMGLFLGALIGLSLYTLKKGFFHFPDIYLLSPQWIGLAAYFVLPRRWSAELNWNAITGIPIEKPGNEENKLRGILMERLNGLAEVFDQLSQSFAPVEPHPETERPADIYTMIEELCQKNCQPCTGYELCWGENFYITYREVFDLFALAEMVGQVTPKQLNGRLAKHCFQQFRLLSGINHRMERQKSSVFWQRRLEESRGFLSGQLQGVADIMSNLAREIRLNVDFRNELEAKLKQAFNRWGMSLRELSVVQMGKDRLEIRVEKRNCGGAQECRFVMAPLVSRILGQKFMVWQHDCRHRAEDSICTCLLCPARKYSVQTAVCKKPHKDNVTSGDSYAMMEMKEGCFISILSDGMGVGPKAAAESGTTVSILEQLLRAGLNREFAVRMVNSVLLLRNQEETFATLDLVLVDLYTAQAEFIKIGAAPTYIKSGRDVTVIRSTSLPVGILNSVDAETSKLPLKAGDYVVMVTDGLLEGRENAEQGEDWVWRALKRVEVTGAEALGQHLLDLATTNNAGAVGDDVTIVVLRIESEPGDTY